MGFTWAAPLAACVLVLPVLAQQPAAEGADLPPEARVTPRTTSHSAAIRSADFLLDLQNAAGAIPDAPGSRRVNEDSNMEYALIGLGAAYDKTGRQRFLTGLESGIAWLAAREDMSSTRWRGSWHYVYSATSPFKPIPTSPGRGIDDVRGVDATSALFAYLVWLHGRLTGDDSLALTYEQNVRAALDFVLDQNQAADGFFYSSWQLRDGTWNLWKFQYSADQGDVYLGLRGGALLYGEPRYDGAADFLKANVPSTFFDPKQDRYALGRDRSGSRDLGLEGFNGIFPQGYLPWMLGADRQNRDAVAWLGANRKTDGRIVVGDGKAYALSPTVFAMGRAGLGADPPRRSLRWLRTARPQGPFDDGCIHDTRDGGPCYPNVAGFGVIALLGWLPFS